jgi:hypothetical protein
VASAFIGKSMRRQFLGEPTQVDQPRSDGRSCEASL